MVWSCSIPEKVKKGSSDLVSAHEKFISENDRLYDLLYKTIENYTEKAKQSLNDKLESRIRDLPQKNLEKMLKQKRKEKKLADTATVTLTQQEELDLINVTMESQKEILKAYNEDISTFDLRLQKIQSAISTLKAYEKELYASTKSLDTYIQVQKFHEALWAETKGLLEGRNSKLDELIKKIDAISANN